MKCPKCGYQRQTRDNAFTPATECPACGIIYAKHDSINSDPIVLGAIPHPRLKPSPVDAVSLKKARERVEKRLRKQLEIKVKDQRHEETLKRARLFAEQAVRARQENWIKEKGAEATDPESNTADGQTELPLDVYMETIILESSDIVSSGPGRQVEDAGLSENQSLPCAPADELTEKPLEPTNPSHRLTAAHRFGGKRVRLVHSIAWIILSTGIIGAVLSWTTISDVQAGVNLPVPDSLSSLPLGLLLGFAYLATGAIGFALFHVSLRISRQLKEVRRLLLNHPVPVLALGETAGSPQTDPIDM